MSINYERKMIDQEVNTLDVEYDTLKQVQDKIADLVERYGPDATVQKCSDAWSDYTYLGIFVKGLETDQQYNKRLTYEKKWAEDAEARDVAEFNRLKKRFESS